MTVTVPRGGSGAFTGPAAGLGLTVAAACAGGLSRRLARRLAEYR